MSGSLARGEEVATNYLLDAGQQLRELELPESLVTIPLDGAVITLMLLDAGTPDQVTQADLTLEPSRLETFARIGSPDAEAAEITNLFPEGTLFSLEAHPDTKTIFRLGRYHDTFRVGVDARISSETNRRLILTAYKPAYISSEDGRTLRTVFSPRMLANAAGFTVSNAIYALGGAV